MKKTAQFDKLPLKTKDLTADNIAKISSLFPSLITEVEKDGKVIKTINASKLKEVVGDYASSDSEVYELTWVGKQESKQKIVAPITKTLRPVPEDSVDFENTENLYIEGDNFEVLKVLQESYLNKIKMIYIDPPYNTGKDFVYKDNFSQSKDEYDEESGAVDEEGNKLFRNTTTNGRFHSDWLSMMYERLVVAKDLLIDDGVIFISIDDNEVANLRKICDEVFGEENFVGNFIWKNKAGGGGKQGGNKPGVEIKKKEAFVLDHEYILVYSKDIYETLRFNEELTDKEISNYTNPDNDPKGPYKLGNLEMMMPKPISTMYYKMKDPDGVIVQPRGGRHQWRFCEERTLAGLKDKSVVWVKSKCNPSVDKRGYKYILKSKQYLYNEGEERTKIARSILSDKGLGADGTREIMELLGQNKTEMPIFTNPKPVDLIKYITKIVGTENKIVLDFFSGSATTAHAVMQLNADNAEDGGNRKFIMVQLPEKTEEDSEAFKAGYKNICEIGKERIRRAAKKIQEELKEKNKQSKLSEEKVDLSKLDFGFRVFRLDSSNMKDVYYNPSEIDQRTLTNFKDNIKEDRTDKDLLYQILLDLAVPISAKVEEQEIKKKTIYKVNENFLIACFDEDIDLEIVKEIAKLNPLRLVFKDSSFKDDSAKVNAAEFLKHKLSGCIVRVI